VSELTPVRAEQERWPAGESVKVRSETERQSRRGGEDLLGVEAQL